MNIECLVSCFTNYDIVLAVIYRPPSYPMSLFKASLNKFLTWVKSFDKPVAIVGDFNDDVLTSSSICQFMTDKGFVQHVTQPTTERGTLIDHVYVSSSISDVESIVVPTYFSDHEGIICTFKIRNST